MLLVPLVLVLVVAAVALVRAASTRGPAERVEHTLLGGGGPPLVLVVVVGAVVVFIGAPMLLFGIRGGGGGDDAAPAPIPPSPVVTTAPPTTVTKPAPRGEPRRPDVMMMASKEAGATGSAVADGLGPRTVLHVVATRFDPFSSGQVMQCVLGPGDPRECTNHFPVNFDGDGRAEFQYLLEDHIAGRNCGPTAACVLVVSQDDIGLRAVAFTVFGARAPEPGVVTVLPDAELVDGRDITVDIKGYPGHTRVVAAQCARPGPREVGRCGRSVEARTGADGSARLHLRAHEGELAPDVTCGPRDLCAVVVSADAPLAPVVNTLLFAAGPTADYEAWRVAAGVAVAALLLGLAFWFVRTTDWREPAEAATPAMDAAVLET